jgi:PAS domain S-box-containing protein
VLLNARVLLSLLEAADDAGLSREDLLRPLGLEAAEILMDGKRIEWSTLTHVLAELSRLVDADKDRIRDIGRRMTRVPSFVGRKVVANIVSPRTLFQMAERWVAPANFPHLRLFIRFLTEERMQVHADIPSSYAPSEPFFYIVEGNFSTFPELIGLAPARIVESQITPRTLDVVFDLPPSVSLFDRVRKRLQRRIRARATKAVLEHQRQELTEDLEALQRAREQLRELLERLPDIVMVHVSGTLVWGNRAFVDFLGYDTIDQLVGRPLLDFVAPQSRQLTIERMSMPSTSDELAFTEAVMMKRNGEEVVIEVAPTQSVVFDGVPARLVVGRDVSERRRMQQKLIVADRLASIGLLAAGVAHEVNNPLGYVLNNIEIARREMAGLGEAADQSREVLSVALEGVDRIRVIVRDLLLLSRGEQGPMTPIDVRIVAQSTLNLAAQEIERTARLVQEYGPAPLVRASDARLAQVLLNLVANALEAMRGRPRHDNRLVVRIGRAQDGRLMLEVSDTGIGISELNLPRVFDPFFTTKPAGQGTGLGLSIAQQLVVEVGGEIHVTSSEGKGTTFQVLLPVAPSVSYVGVHAPT